MSDRISGPIMTQESDKRSADYEHRIAHLEALEPLMVPGDLPFAIPAITLGLANADGAADFVIRSDATLIAQALGFGVGVAPTVDRIHTYRDDASTVPTLLIEQDGAGDAAQSWLLTGGQTFSMGIDNSVSDRLIISGGADLQTNPYVTISEIGRFGVGTTNPLQIGHFEAATAIVRIQSTGVGAGAAFDLIEGGGQSWRFTGSAGAWRVRDVTNVINKFQLNTGAAGDAWFDNFQYLGVHIQAPLTDVHIYENTADTTPAVRIEQDGAGDAALNFLLTGGQNWSMGIDNSVANDPLIIAAGADLATNPYIAILPTGLVGQGILAPLTFYHLYEDSASVVPQIRLEQDGAGDAAINFLLTGATGVWSAGVDNSDADKFKISRGVNLNTDTRLTVTQLGEVGIETDAPAGQLHVDQSDNVGGLPVLVLDQADISEGTINFIASDRGVITGATDSLESVRVELGGVVRRIALYVDA